MMIEQELKLIETHYTNMKDYYIMWETSPQNYNEAYKNNNPGRRVRQTNKIFDILDKWIKENRIPKDFIMLDVFCGDGLILKSIKERYPKSEIHGVDVFTEEFNIYQIVLNSGVKLYRIPAQLLIENNLNEKVDIIMMMNSYRAFRDTIGDGKNPIIKRNIDVWIDNNTDNFIWEGELKGGSKLNRNLNK